MLNNNTVNSQSLLIYSGNNNTCIQGHTKSVHVYDKNMLSNNYDRQCILFSIMFQITPYKNSIC